MHPDDLRKLWLCQECGLRFSYSSDVDDHKRQFKHSKLMLCDLQLANRKMPPLFLRGRTAIDFKINGKGSLVIIEYEYYPSNGKINYVDVKYSNEELKSKVESEPEMMKNIDAYLRKVLTRRMPVKPHRLAKY